MSHSQSRDKTPTRQKKSLAETNYDAVVVGAGVAGLYMLYRLRKMGLSIRIFEAGSDVGGTWYWNRYPGARCDVESMQYSYQFSEALQQEWTWTERYATQPEILRYLHHVTERFNLRPDIQFDTRVEQAHFDEEAACWRIATDDGAQVTARFCIMATGCLSAANMPQIPGRDSFHGPLYHTGKWPHEGVDFSGQRVGIIGTGSSAIQSIPIIAAQADHLFVFQRTANFSVPAHNGPLDPAYVQSIKEDYAGYRKRNNLLPGALNVPRNEASVLDATPDEIQQAFEERWQMGGFSFMGAFGDLGLKHEANAFAAEFVRNKIRQIVQDPAVADLLCPEQVIGCKRLCLDSGYFETFNRPNVTLVDVSKRPIERLTEAGIQVGDQAYPVDCVVFATGFDAMTGALDRIDIRGRKGLPLKEKWYAGPRTYLGLSTVGFPNLFMVSGPGSPSVLTNMMPSIEQHVNWIADCIDHLRTNGRHCIEPTQSAEDAWVDHVNEVANGTLMPTCNSWYLGANIPGKPRVFMPYIGFPAYVEKCEQVVADGYAGFVLA